MKLRKLIFTLIIILFTLAIFEGKSEASLYLNKLDFKAELNSDGSMNVVEEWDIKISETNTLYKTFQIDTSKYTAITNFSVKEITGNQNKLFKETDRWAYHIDKNYYFGGINNDGKYEIAWGVGLDNSTATRKYLISYTIEDVVKKYGDCTELYWQFVEKDFEISAEKITGTITLPEKVKDIKELRAWGGTKKLNGEIYATSKDTIEFSLNRHQAGNFVEVRVAMPNYVMEDLRYTSKQDKLDYIIKEETKWAEEANRQRIVSKRIIIFIIIVVVLGVVLFIKMIKYSKIIRGKYKPTQKLKYFREIPNKETTPGEALFLLLKGKTSLDMGNIFSATILDLKLKGYLEIKESNRGKIKIKIIKNASKELPVSEKIVFEFMKEIIKDKEITIKKMQEIITRRSKLTSKMVKNLKDSIIDIQKGKGNFYEEDRKKEKFEKIYNFYYISLVCCIMFLLILIILTLEVPILLTLVLLVILMIINSILFLRIFKRDNVLTQKGVDEREKWKGLKKYMLDFSLLNEKEVYSIQIWEEYLVYATVFGIANKVIEQLKLKYLQIEEMSTSDIISYEHFMENININFSSLEKTSSSLSRDISRDMSRNMSRDMSRVMSSGSGRGGGFSGGGGGRRPAEEVGGGR